jgi:hypothetical protein
LNGFFSIKKKSETSFFKSLFFISSKISDHEIETFLNKHEPLKAKFDAYIQLKLILSPIIEYIILLDRFIYLFECNCENNHKNKNYLVKLFDPTKSPRCYALVSYLNEE